MVETIAQLPLEDCHNLRSLSNATGLSLGTLHRWFREGMFVRHSSAILPHLTDKQKVARVKWVLEHVRPSGLFEDMYNVVAVDEKRFYLKTLQQKYYLSEDKPKPICKNKSKKYIPKVMFLAAVAQHAQATKGDRRTGKRSDSKTQRQITVTLE